jgi:hypothetical protein
MPQVECIPLCTLAAREISRDCVDLRQPHDVACLRTSRLPPPIMLGGTSSRIGESVEVEVTLRPTVSRPVSLGFRRPSGTGDQFYFLLEIFFRQLRVCNFVAPSLMRGRVCNLLYNYFWALSEQSLLGRSPAKLTAIFYCLI